MKKTRTLRRTMVVVVVLILLFAMSSTALATNDSTDVEVTWVGGGTITGTVDTGDALTGFTSNAALSSGTFKVTDANDNSYGYGVDQMTMEFTAGVTDGSVSTQTNRLTSAGMYGAAGQTSYSFVGVNNGTASIAARTSTNYAALSAPTYGYQLPGGHNIVANANVYEMWTGITNGQGNGGEVYAKGNGSAQLDAMTSGASGNGGIQLGWGGGCYTDANFQATGTGGTFKLTGVGSSQVTFEGMGITSGGGNLQLMANWLGSVSVDDFSLTAR